MKSKTVALVALVFLIGCLVGFIIGSTYTITIIANLTSGFIDRQMIEDAIGQYKDNIKNCYPSIFENASVYDNTGN